MKDKTPIPAQPDQLRPIAEAAVRLPDVASAAIFVTREGSTVLELGAAAGVEETTLQRLTEAVRNSAHPIARTAALGEAEFDVTPMAPGGPALRSHLPLVIELGGARVVVGVLAVAHEHNLDAAVRQSLAELAEQAAALIRGD